METFAGLPKEYKKNYLQEALGSGAAGLVVIFVFQAFLLVALLPAQSRIFAVALHGRDEHLVDRQSGFSGQTGLLHPQLHLSIALRRPQTGFCCRHRQGVWALGAHWKMCK